MSDNLIQEIEDSIRQEKLEKLWKEYGVYLLAGAVLIVLGTALVTGWRSWNEKTNASQTEQIMAAIERPDAPQALTQAAPGLRPGHRAVAQLNAAGLFLRDGKTVEAAAAYEAVAQGRDIDPALRDLATLMAVRLQWEQTPQQDAVDGLLARLTAIHDDAGSPWRYHARIQAAVILAQGRRDYTAARQHLGVVTAAQGIPASLQERASALNQVYDMQQAAAGGAAADSMKEEPEG